MAKGYWVVAYQAIKNQEAWQAYAKVAKPVIEQMGGKYLARTNPAKTYENGINQRVVLIEFASVQAAIACHDSPGYQQALKHIAGGAVTRDLRVVEGVE
jgi:uncharacterized protein (DUF1330 family)